MKRTIRIELTETQIKALQTSLEVTRANTTIDLALARQNKAHALVAFLDDRAVALDELQSALANALRV